MQRWRKKRPEGPLICKECGRPAVKGYDLDGERYCDRCAEDVIRRSTRERLYGGGVGTLDGSKRRKTKGPL